MLPNPMASVSPAKKGIFGNKSGLEKSLRASVEVLSARTGLIHAILWKAGTFPDEDR